jgi:heat shock protein HslJ
MMKTNITLLTTIFAVLISSCATNKNISNAKLYNTTWEREYITGSDIAFGGLYPDKKPKISFNKENNEVSGDNSCNGYTADYTITGNSIFFGEPGPTTMMFCGEGEKVFLNRMNKINKYGFDQDGKLNLMIDDVPMMRFKKVENH